MKFLIFLIENTYGSSKQLRYLKGTLTLGLYYPKCLDFDLKGYSDSDYAGCNMDRKSTSAEAEYVATAGCYASILWMKTQLSDYDIHYKMSVAMSSAEAEYIATARCCVNILWMKSQLSDYDIHYKMVPIFYDNTSSIAISNNPILHSRTKHIDIRYHFMRDHILKGDTELHFIPTEYQLADIFTKPLDEPTFTRLKADDLVTKLLNKSRLRYGSYLRFISCALEALLGLEYTQDEKFGYLHGIPSNFNFSKDPSKVIKIELMAHMIIVNNQKDSVSPLPLSAKKKKSKTSYEVKLDTEALQIKTFANVQAFLLSNDDMVQESNDDVFEAREYMEEDTQDDEEEYHSPPLNTDKSKPSDQEAQES
nr:copia protein [Tanacetum cinerariifolium]